MIGLKSMLQKLNQHRQKALDGIHESGVTQDARIGVETPKTNELHY